MDLKPGSRWKSAVCDTEVVVVRAPPGATNLECGGHPMAAHADEKPTGLTLAPEHSGGSLLGKRYADAAGVAEILCTKAGAGSLALDGEALVLKETKKLPSSD